MKKKILSLTLVVCLLAIAVVGGTLAYFKDTDSAKNVMTMGDLHIVQNEQQLNEEGALVDFEQNKPMMPAVYPVDYDKTLFVDGYFNPAINNVVDKIVTVTNTAGENAINQDAYVRTILAFETNDVFAPNESTNPKDAHDEYFLVLGNKLQYLKDEDGNFLTFERTEGEETVKYVLAVRVYDDPLAPGMTTEPSLKQILMTNEAGNEVVDLFGSEYTILALSQATQVQGFENVGAAVALNTAFGEVTAANAATWFADVQ